MNKVFFIVLLLMVVSVFVSNYITFFDKKDYDFIVEAPCDELNQTCFTRDCSVEGDCPPNNLSTYRVFTIKASDFDTCSNNSCINECKSNAISCEETICDESAGDECVFI